jgi:hypothetical protein
MLLRDIHSKLIDQYDCKEVCAPSPSQVNSGARASLSSQDGVPQQQQTNPKVMVIQQWSKQSFHPHHPGGVSDPPLDFFFLQIYWENAKFQCKKKGLFTHIVT